MPEYQLFIYGEYCPASSGKTEDSLNPATGEVYATAHEAKSEDSLKALDAVEKAF
jgi:acyl-CoA reductase-like NAD-dependent aldehyde dehydrogenase|tara:strand:+ start:1069 stop:1233 length:165 start_codon:yes stop_codon:yes gene_type:complete